MDDFSSTTATEGATKIILKDSAALHNIFYRSLTFSHTYCRYVSFQFTFRASTKLTKTEAYQFKANKQIETNKKIKTTCLSHDISEHKDDWGTIAKLFGTAENTQTYAYLKSDSLKLSSRKKFGDSLRIIAAV